MKKIPIILSALLLSAMSAAADETALRLSLRDGSSATYVLSDRPVISFSGEQMMIECDNASTAYNRSEVTSLAFFTKGTTQLAVALPKVIIIAVTRPSKISFQSTPIYIISLENYNNSVT